MIELFTDVRKRLHRTLELRLRSDYLNTAMGDPESVRNGVDRMLGYIGYCAGLPPPRCEEVVVVEEGPILSLGYVGEPPIYFVTSFEDPLIAMNRLDRVIRLLPARFFGMEQAVRWVELARFPPHHLIAEQAAAALGDAADGEVLARIVFRLLEERVPLDDVKTILETVAAHGAGAGVDAVTEDVRTALRERSAAYYTDYFAVGEAFRIGAALLRDLDAPDGEETVGEAICRFAKAATSVFVIVVEDASRRRRVWELTERLFMSERLNRPAVVLKSDELPSSVSLPQADREIRVMAALGL